MKQYVRKPHPVEALQHTGNEQEAQEFMGQYFLGTSDGLFLIETPDGVRRVLPKDFIVKHPNGTFTAVREGVFLNEYSEYPEPQEPVQE